VTAGRTSEAEPRRALEWAALALALVALGYGSRIFGGEPAADIVFQYAFGFSALVQYGVIGALMLLIARRSAGRELFALRLPPQRWRAAVPAAAAFASIFVVAVVLERFLHAGEEQGLTPSGWDSTRAGAFAFSFVAVTVFAPVVEELLYRGLGYSLLERFGPLAAIGLTGLAFAAAHGLLAGLPTLWFFGAALAWLRARTDSVYPAIAVHALFNGMTLAAAVAM